MVHRLSTDDKPNVAAVRLIAFVCERIAQLFADADCPDKRAKAEAALQLLLQPDTALSARVRSVMLQCLQFDPILHGLLHAVAAAAHCDGACMPESARALVLGVQPGADVARVRWLHDAATDACTSMVPKNFTMLRIPSLDLEQLVSPRELGALHSPRSRPKIRAQASTVNLVLSPIHSDAGRGTLRRLKLASCACVCCAEYFVISPVVLTFVRQQFALASKSFGAPLRRTFIAA